MRRTACAAVLFFMGQKKKPARRDDAGAAAEQLTPCAGGLCPEGVRMRRMFGNRQSIVKMPLQWQRRAGW
jgi:hypothetical protein